MRVFKLNLIAAVLSVCAVCAQAGDASKELSVFAAASLTQSFKEIGKQFEAKNPGTKVMFSFGASNQLRAQIENGAKADIFASANTKEMNAAVKAGSVADGKPRTFVQNRLVVALPKGNPGKIESLADLAKPKKKIVVADAAVPVGKYTLDMLEAMVKDESYGAKFKEGFLANIVSKEENVKAVVMKVQLGEADAGVVYFSDTTTATSELKTIDVPDSFNQIATYPIAVVSDTSNPELSQAFVEYVLSDDAQKVLEKNGFLRPAKKP